VDAAGKALLTIERRPDGNWLDIVERICIAPDGSVAVASRASSITWRGEGAGSSLSTYSASGDPVRSLPIPYIKRLHGLAYDGKRIVVTGEAGGFVFDSEGQAISRFEPEGKTAAGATPRCYLAHGGTELWLWSPETRIIRRFEAQ